MQRSHWDSSRRKRKAIRTKRRPHWTQWRHITKLDPDKQNPPELIQAVAESGTDAVMISGTQNVTIENVKNLVTASKNLRLPIILEPSSPQAVTFEIDFLFIPAVMNSQDSWWINGAHIDWILRMKKSMGSFSQIPWNKIVPEAYIVLNPESAVAKVTHSTTNLDADQVVAHAIMAANFLSYPIVYIEYSGIYGDPTLVKRVRQELPATTLLYGGGINSQRKAEEMSRYATIVVGNIVYEDLDKYRSTIPARRRKGRK